MLHFYCLLAQLPVCFCKLPVWCLQRLKPSSREIGWRFLLTHLGFMASLKQIFATPICWTGRYTSPECPQVLQQGVLGPSHIKKPYVKTENPHYIGTGQVPKQECKQRPNKVLHTGARRTFFRKDQMTLKGLWSIYHVGIIQDVVYGPPLYGSCGP